MPSSFAEHFREIARRFLLTAVVVDDELSVARDTPVRGGLTPPGRREVERPRKSMDIEADTPRPLDVDPITWSFARQGMVCGVLSPHEAGQGRRARDLAKAVARADILILDWKLDRESGADALPLLHGILMDDRHHRLRLVAFYTGEPDREAIRDKIVESLRDLDAPYRTVSVSDEDGGAINFGSCRIVVYGKPGSGARDLTGVVQEAELADRLIGDFADMAEGLLPSLVLTALASVRDNEYRVLERFGRSLDPAFLAHRASLPQPQDAGQHMVEQIASELHGIMEDALGERKPAGIEAIEHWLADRFGGENVVFGPNKEMSRPEVLEMLAHGVEEKPGPLRKGGKDHDILSRGFSGGDNNRRELDRRLASVMSFRQVIEGAPPQMAMGTVVRRVEAEGETTLLCVTPRCDSVRLKGPSSFLFLPLTRPQPDTPQLVVPTDDNEHRRMTISMNPSRWRIEDFSPDPDQERVLATGGEPSQPFTFKDVSGGEYRWVGELKAEFAQSIAQSIAERMSRMPLNKSEWLRRSERVGKREN